MAAMESRSRDRNGNHRKQRVFAEPGFALHVSLKQLLLRDRNPQARQVGSISMQPTTKYLTAAKTHITTGRSTLRSVPSEASMFNIDPPPPCPRTRMCRYAGASDESITRTVEIALGLPRGTPAVIRDPEDGSALAVSDSLPDGLTLDATAAAATAAVATAVLGGNVGEGGEPKKWGGSSSGSGKHVGGGGGGDDSRSGRRRSGDGFYGSSEIAGNSSGNSHSNRKNLRGGGGGGGGGDGSIGNSGPGGAGAGSGDGTGGAAQEFRGELLKFERVNAHLANERTWLAWVRTALSVLGVALSLISLTDDMGSASMDSTALALGVAFVLCTLFTYMTGWLRYARVKEVLTWTGSQVKGKFGRFGLQYFTWFLGGALVLTVPIYLMAGVNVVEDA